MECTDDKMNEIRAEVEGYTTSAKNEKKNRHRERRNRKVAKVFTMDKLNGAAGGDLLQDEVMSPMNKDNQISGWDVNHRTETANNAASGGLNF